MTEAGVALIAGGLVFVTALVVTAAPVRGPAVLGMVALGIAAGCLIVGNQIGISGYFAEDVKVAILALLGVVHVVVGFVLLGISTFNRRQRDRDG